MRYLITSNGDASNGGDRRDDGGAIPSTCGGASTCGGDNPSNGGGAIPIRDGPSRGGGPNGPVRSVLH